ncbi:MAG TPA: ABC transporter ATP-binding protein [Bacteroidia bacterium]|nr:ABC transporter ATP-binding protein [Bacteroidia bacterium]
MKILLAYLKNYRGMVALALLLAAVNQCFSMLDPYIYGKILNKFGVGHETYKGDTARFIQDIIPYLLGVISVAMVSRIAKNFQDYYTSVIIQRTGAQLYQDGIKRSLDLPFQEFEDQRSGETLGKLQKVRADCEKFITSFISVIFQTLVGFTFVLIFAIQANWMIAPVFFITGPILAFLSNLLSKKIKTISKKIVGETTALAGSTTESLRNVELVKSLGLTTSEIGRLNTITSKILVLELKKVRYIRSLSFVQGTVVNFLRTTLVFVLYYLVFKNEINVGQLLTLTFYSFFIFNPLQELGNIVASYREVQASLNNFEKLMSTPVEQKPATPAKLGAIEKLTFNKVAFKHRTASANAVEDISFTINKGETVAFVGPSGSGKTTLVKLLVGLYNPMQGDVLYNDKKANEINLDELRVQLGFVSQDTQLFSGTIKENLLFVKPDATDEQCKDALQKAACNTLMQRADNGLDTIIGEGGIKISGGEKQRLSIARALLRNPKLLIFDEATSALDSLTEVEITETIRDISGKKEQITVMIAHRLSTIMNADKIYVLERGKIIEEGQHNYLLELKGLYYAMWRQQVGERKKEAITLPKIP